MSLLILIFIYLSLFLFCSGLGNLGFGLILFYNTLEVLV